MPARGLPPTLTKLPFKIVGESPGELNTDLEDSGEKPPEEAPRPPAPGRVLGDFARRKTLKVQPFLPAWLAKPSCVKKSVTEDLTPIEDIHEVHPDLQKQLRANGISSYFPGPSALVNSPRQPSLGCQGSNALLHRVVCHIHALVVLPTKELAQQICPSVSKVFNIYTDTTPLRVALVTGQKSLAKEQESLVQKT
ncbi:ATP-dependent RNA helicase DDX51 [Microtus ochrogaster]|uniref:ATP-dependent RNA helicase DDX51 n=1 Tax=Microtus ochrogaster TaxID=79684 RepID=A0A8J6KIA5_MICOH|nr:ATP-dependent RNA helicase DDX51 [Microtus ochrogaster]